MVDVDDAQECAQCTSTPCVCAFRLFPEEQHRCSACDVPGCWAARSTCHFRGRQRDDHADAALGDIVPHMYQTVVRWQPSGLVDIDGVRYEAGKADGLGCNCLIESLRQVLGFAQDADACRLVRDKLRQKYWRRDASFVGEGTYLYAHEHWEDVVRYWAEVTGAEVAPEDLTVTCLSWQHDMSGMVEGRGPRRVYIVNDENRHFDPLLPVPQEG